MSHKKQDFKNLSLKDLQDHFVKKGQLREDEIKDIKHEGKKLLLAFLCNPLTYLLIAAFGCVWFYLGDPKQAIFICSTYLLEFFILRHFERNS